MSFGLSPAPEEFQKRIDLALEGLPGQKVIADNILVLGSGDTDEEALKDHDRNLREVLTRCQHKGIELNVDKMQFRKKEVTYRGQSPTGVQALIQIGWGPLMTCKLPQTSNVSREYLAW